MTRYQVFANALCQLIHENELFNGVGWGTSMEVNIISCWRKNAPSYKYRQLKINYLNVLILESWAFCDDYLLLGRDPWNYYKFTTIVEEPAVSLVRVYGTRFSKALVNLYQNTRTRISEDNIRHCHCCENLKSNLCSQSK